MPSIVIDGVSVRAAAGSTVLEAARKAGIRIPTLCHFEGRKAIGSCRLCVVEVEGGRHPVPACATPARDGMRVATSSERLSAYRRMALELMVSQMDAAPSACSELGELCREYGVALPDAASAPSGDAAARWPVLDANPFLSYDPGLCIRCQRCVGACNEAARNHTLKAGKRGVRTIIEAPFGPDWRATACESCGNCAQACPTGAISLKRGAQAPGSTRKVRTTCPHCGVGCQIDLAVEDGRIVAAEGAPGPSNKGLLCVKGRSASFDFVQAPDRLTAPLVRNPATGELEPASWDEALDLVASRFSALRDAHGGESLAAFACSRSTNEDVYLFQKMGRTALRTNNIDSCARV